MQIEQISADDYFAKNAEFTAWLRDERGKFFNEMDADETRALFGAKLMYQSLGILFLLQCSAMLLHASMVLRNR